MKSPIPMYRLLLLIAIVTLVGFTPTNRSDFSTVLAQQDTALFSDDFSTDPNTSGLWRIHRLHSGDTTNEASWDTASQELYLTRAVGSRAVAMFANYELTETQWEAQFRYKVGGGSGADGFVFMFYKDESAYGAPGHGGFLGFQYYFGNSISGYGVEFDNRYNPPGDQIGDPSANHIALIQDRVGNHLAYTNDSRTEGNIWHEALIQFDNGHVVVSIDGQFVLDYLISNPDYTYSGIGFSSATGQETNNHIIDDFILRSNTSTSYVGFDMPLNVTSKSNPYAPNVITLETKVKNFSLFVTVPLVTVAFYNGDPDVGGQKIYESSISNIAPGASEMISAIWILDENKRIFENQQIFARIINPMVSSTINRGINIYYVDFRHDRDAYKFKNDEIPRSDDGEVKKFLSDSGFNPLLSVILRPVFHATMEKNGFCYGVANSSILYFNNDSLKPSPRKQTIDYTVTEAKEKIYTYQWNALVPLLLATFGKEVAGADVQYQFTKSSIKLGTPVVHFLMYRVPNSLDPFPPPNKGPHATVAYKVIEVGDEKQVYYYDPNFPLKSYSIGATQAYGKIVGSTFSYYNSADYNRVVAFPPVATLLDVKQELLELVKRVLDAQFTESLTSISTDGAVDLLAIDALGRRTGFIAGQQYNEIPNSISSHISGEQSLLLPTDGTYRINLTKNSVTISAIYEKDNQTDTNTQGSDTFSVNIVDPISGSSAQVIQFQDISLTSYGQANITFNHSNYNVNIEIPDGLSYQPTINMRVQPSSALLPFFQR